MILPFSLPSMHACFNSHLQWIDLLWIRIGGTFHPPPFHPPPKSIVTFLCVIVVFWGSKSSSFGSYSLVEVISWAQFSPSLALWHSSFCFSGLVLTNYTNNYSWNFAHKWNPTTWIVTTKNSMRKIHKFRS
jgi:hypothetical protein